jgi:hypothetical protein
MEYLILKKTLEWIPYKGFYDINEYTTKDEFGKYIEQNG